METPYDASINTSTCTLPLDQANSNQASEQLLIKPEEDFSEHQGTTASGASEGSQPQVETYSHSSQCWGDDAALQSDDKEKITYPADVKHGKSDETPDCPITEKYDEIHSILEDVGGLGPWQFFIAGVNMLMTIIAGIHTNAYPLLVGSSNSWRYACKSVNDSNFTIDAGIQECGVQVQDDSHPSGFSRVDCSEAEGFHMVYSHDHFETTVTTEFDLMCGYGSYLVPLVHSSFTIGCFFGVLIFGYLADCFGRKTVLYFGVPIAIALNFSLALAPNVFIFLAIRLLQGTAVFGIFTILYVIAMETTLPRRRAAIGNIVHIPWGLQFITVSLIAMWIKEWRMQQLVYSVPAFLCLICLTPLMPESPRWLAINGKTEQATKVFMKAAKWNRRSNKVTEKSINDRVENFYETSKAAEPKGANSKLTLYMGLIRTPEMRRRFLLSTVVWFQIAFVNHGYNIYAPTLAKNPYFAYCLVGVIETLSPCCGAFLFTFGRRKPLVAIFIMTGLLSMSLIPVFKIWPENYQTQILVLVLAVSFLSDMAFNGIYVHVSEFMPTTHRSIGLGSCSSIARIGSSLCSGVVQTASTYPTLPPAIFGVLSLAGAFCNFFLPVTENKELPETVTQIEDEAARLAKVPVGKFSNDDKGTNA